MKPEIEMEMNGQVIDQQLSQLIHCPLDIRTKRGPVLLERKKERKREKEREKRKEGRKEGRKEEE